MPQKIKVLSFDLDDTLWPCMPTIQRAEKLLYQWLSENVPEITQRYDIDQLYQKRREQYKANPDLIHDLTRLRFKSFEALSKEFELDKNWMQPAFEVFYEARQQVTLFDDVEPVLDLLTNKFQLASLTNGNADVVKTGVDHWFDVSLNSSSVGKRKSEPDIYRQVLKLANIDAPQMVHIGDDPMQDISGAKSAGVFAIWLNREQQQWSLQTCEPDAEISSLHELMAILEQMA
jgi:HAD superfamily hydrolase (TIGR01549 family)